jgi:hypothetical protein
MNVSDKGKEAAGIADNLLYMRLCTRWDEWMLRWGAEEFLRTRCDRFALDHDRRSTETDGLD